ncbi:hypothetical protein HX37_16615 [Salmonella enterica]|uniref:Uncharacterized protein n=1 Tax=Salmonella enterica TaxID=28901 RepID=A0A5U2F648_SALER|nr:hypothetical protein [Salmonella enterica]EBH8037502.1 hypothetical protein [Salmonella bongori]ECG0831000.1 hypothetical protein [Salmonella enterica subsp. diarizonae]EAP3485592.1 hypothetical protein [Salmonella enterica]EBD6774063.1 hypothetical protein [Salmonella enterica]
MKNGESYLQKELVRLRLKTIILAMVVRCIPLLKGRCRTWFMRNADFLLDYAENGLLNSEDRNLINSVGVTARRFDECCHTWCQCVITCSLLIEFEWKHAGNC